LDRGPREVVGEASYLAAWVALDRQLDETKDVALRDRPFDTVALNWDPFFVEQTPAGVKTLCIG
jgi:hypothetical protein